MLCLSFLPVFQIFWNYFNHTFSYLLPDSFSVSLSFSDLPLCLDALLTTFPRCPKGQQSPTFWERHEQVHGVHQLLHPRLSPTVSTDILWNYWHRLYLFNGCHIKNVARQRCETFFETTRFSVFLSNIDIDFNSYFSTNFTVDEGTGKVPSCVPYYEFMTEQANKVLKQDNSSQAALPIVILAAFEYEEHMSVTIQNDGLLG